MAAIVRAAAAGIGSAALRCLGCCMTAVVSMLMVGV